jgi:dephospho-CoA kinase
MASILLSILGETGCGKEEIANILHSKHGYGLVKSDKIKPPDITNSLKKSVVTILPTPIENAELILKEELSVFTSLTVYIKCDAKIRIKRSALKLGKIGAIRKAIEERRYYNVLRCDFLFDNTFSREEEIADQIATIVEAYRIFILTNGKGLEEKDT